MLGTCVAPFINEISRVSRNPTVFMLMGNRLVCNDPFTRSQSVFSVISKRQSIGGGLHLISFGELCSQ